LNKSFAHLTEVHAAITVSAAQFRGKRRFSAAFSPCSSIKETTMFYSVATRPARSFNGSCAPAAGHQALEKFLSDTFSSLSATGAAQPAAVQDLEKTYSLQLDVPGLAKEQLDIGIEGDVVRVSSKADAVRSVKAAWRFPLEIDVASSSAKLENGVLTLSLGKKIPVNNISQLAIE
jgi:HSP20 family protein